MGSLVKKIAIAFPGIHQKIVAALLRLVSILYPILDIFSCYREDSMSA